ncbi:ATP-dependent DNA helicase PIF1-like protein [Tanacetum coccineum]
MPHNIMEHMLLCNNKILKHIPNMPYPNEMFTMASYNRLVYDELKYNKPKLIKERKRLYTTLINEQKGIYHTLIEDVNGDQGGMFFVYGYGGTGKTYLYETLSVALRSKGEIVLNVASSGIAALLLEGGRTAHSRFAIIINVVDDSMCHILADSELAKLIRMAKLIIWDEAPMTHKHCYEAFDRTLRDICQTDPTTPNDKVFGGKVVLFGGDFRQILPVVTNGNWILSIGNGTIGGKNNEEATIEFPEDILIPDSSDHIGSLIEETYPQLIQNLYNPTFFQEKSILAPTHALVDMINDRMLKLIPGDEKTYESSDSVGIVDMDTNFNESLYTGDFLSSIKFAGLPQDSLKLKIGAPVMTRALLASSANVCRIAILAFMDRRKITPILLQGNMLPESSPVTADVRTENFAGDLKVTVLRCSLSGEERKRSGVDAVVNCGEVRDDDSIVDGDGGRVEAKT